MDITKPIGGLADPKRRLLLLGAAAALGVARPALAGSDAARPGAEAKTPNHLDFADWAGPRVRVHLHRPENAAPDAPLVFVMHGIGRRGRAFRDAWRRVADAHGLVIAAPAFPKSEFPGPHGYQIGAAETPERSSHAVIEPMFDAIRARLGLTRETYWMYGHSGGSQFTHRFLFRTGGPRLEQAVCANAGWYLMPAFNRPFPYGLQNAGPAAASIEAALQKPVTILLGETDRRRDGSLRQTARAEAQGRHRVERGHAFYNRAHAFADYCNVDFAWRLAVAPGVGHSNVDMAPFAANALQRQA